MNPFFKAGILTAFILLISYLLAVQFDNARAGALKSDINRVMLENQEREVLLRYAQVMAKNPKDICPNLEALRQNRLGQVNRLDLEIANYEHSNLFNQDYQSLKNSYYVGAVDLLVSGQENAKLCGAKEVPVILFYRQNPTCADCKAEGTILYRVSQRCQMARTYSFPVDSDSEVVRALVNRYGANETPALTIDDGALQFGLVSEEDIVKTLRAHGAVCT